MLKGLHGKKKKAILWFQTIVGKDVINRDRHVVSVLSTVVYKCVTLSSLCLSLSTNPEFSLSLSHPNTYQIVIVIHQICHKQGQLCLHMPSTDFAHAQLRVNMTQKYNL